MWKVNGSLIRSADIRKEVAALRQGNNDMTMEDRLALPGVALENLIEREILRTSAHRLGFTPTDQEVHTALAQLAPRNDGVTGCRAGIASDENIDDIRHRLAIDKLLASTLAKARWPQSWQVAEFYRKNSAHFATPELAHVHHLVTTSEEATENLRTRVLSGEDFAQVAKEASECPEHGGDLGYFARGTMVDEFDEVVFSAPIGELTPIFQTQFGFHTAIVQDRKPAGIRTLQEVKTQIEELLLRQSQDAACGDLLTRLRKSAKIEELPE